MDFGAVGQKNGELSEMFQSVKYCLTLFRCVGLLKWYV